MTASAATDTADLAPSAVRFVAVVSECIRQLCDLAVELRHTEGGTAVVIATFANHQSGALLDVVLR